VVEEFFNMITRENAGRALHAEYPVVYEQARTKWQRLIETTAGDVEPVASGSGTSGQSAGGGGGGTSGSGRGRGGTAVRGRGVRGQRGNSGVRNTTRSTYQGPIATLHGLRACYGYNDDQRPCTRQMRDATTCADATGRNVFIHCCSHYDAVTKKHCLNLGHALYNGGH